MEDKELELLRKYFDCDKEYDDFDLTKEQACLRKQILKIKKQSKLKERIHNFKCFIPREQIPVLDDILKDLGYEH